MKLMKTVIAFCLMFFSLSEVYSYGDKSLINEKFVKKNTSWIFSGSMGFYKINNMLEKDGESFFTRLSVEKIFAEKHNNLIGLEIGVQSGNQARLGMTDSQMDDLGGTAVLTTLKSEFDILFTLHRELISDVTDLYVKVGGMYRQLTMDSSAINDLRKVNLEVQAGLSQNISENVSISLGYQGVFSPGLELQTCSICNTADIRNIPSQHGVLFSAHYNI